MLGLRLVRIAVAAAALILGGLAGSAVEAKKTANPYAAQIAALHETNGILHKADHDYKGHRANAMKEVHRAAHALKHGTKGTKKKHHKHVKGTGGLPQDQSDALLKKAIDQLTTIQGQLATVQDARAVAAVAHIQKAIKELGIALKIK